MTEASKSTPCGNVAAAENEFKYKYCRLCGVELINGVSIYGEEGRGLQLADKIRKTLSILVLEEDALPKRVCTDCCVNLEDYSKYKDTVADAQAKLKAVIQCQSTNVQTSNHNSSRSVHQLLGQGQGDRDGSSNDNGRRAIDGHLNLADPSSRPVVGLPSPPSSLVRCRICGADFGSNAALNVHISNEHSGSNVNSPDQEEEEAIELHIPSPTPSEEPRLVEEHDKPPPSVSVPISQSASDNVENIVASTSQKTSSTIASAIPVVPASSTSTSTATVTSKLAKKGSKPTFHCSQCNKTLASQAGYYNHIMVVHKRRRFDCTLCENTYCSKASLKYHEQNSHATTSVATPTAPSNTSTPLKSTQFKCPECPKSFRTKKRCAEHKKTHTNLRSFECTVCHKFFKTSKCLRNHMLYHAGSRKTFSCPTCNKQFTKSKYLEEHKKVHLPALKLTCPFCPHTFNGFPNYAKHVKRKHQEKIGEDGKVPKALKANMETQADTNNTLEPIPLDEPSTSRLMSKMTSSTLSEPRQQSTSCGVQPQSQSQAITSSSSHMPPNNPTAMPSNGHYNPTPHHMDNQNHSLNTGWSESTKPPPVNQTQINRLHHPSQTQQQYSMTVLPQSQHQHHHHSMPIIPMDDMVDSVIQNALLSHPQPQTLDSSSNHNHGHGHPSSMQFETHHNQRTPQASNQHQNHSSSTYHVLQPSDIHKVSYVTQFEETPLELCVRNNGDESTGENEGDKSNNYNQLVDLTSAKIVDLSGVGLVMAAAASSSNNVHSASNNSATSSLMYRQTTQTSQQQQQHQQQMPTMSMVQMSMLPMDLTDQQQQTSTGMDSSGHAPHMPLSLTSNQSANHHNSTMMTSTLVDLSYTGASASRTGSHFQLQHQQSQQQQQQQQQDEHMMSTSTFLRELLDLSCSTSTTRSIPSTSASLDSYGQHQHLHQQQQQTHFHPQQNYQQSQPPPTQYHQSPPQQHHQPNQIQQYELNLSSKSRGYGNGNGMGPYQGQVQSMSSPSHNQSQTQTTMYQHSQPLSHTNGNGNSNRSTTTNANSNHSATTNQFHNVMYNDTFM